MSKCKCSDVTDMSLEGELQRLRIENEELKLEVGMLQTQNNYLREMLEDASEVYDWDDEWEIVVTLEDFEDE